MKFKYILFVCLIGMLGAVALSGCNTDLFEYSLGLSAEQTGRAQIAVLFNDTQFTNPGYMEGEEPEDADWPIGGTSPSDTDSLIGADYLYDDFAFAFPSLNGLSGSNYYFMLFDAENSSAPIAVAKRWYDGTLADGGNLWEYDDDYVIASWTKPTENEFDLDAQYTSLPSDGSDGATETYTADQAVTNALIFKNLNPNKTYFVMVLADLNGNGSPSDPCSTDMNDCDAVLVGATAELILPTDIAAGIIMTVVNETAKQICGCANPVEIDLATVKTLISGYLSADTTGTATNSGAFVVAADSLTSGGTYELDLRGPRSTGVGEAADIRAVNAATNVLSEYDESYSATYTRDFASHTNISAHYNALNRMGVASIFDFSTAAAGDEWPNDAIDGLVLYDDDLGMDVIVWDDPLAPTTREVIQFALNTAIEGGAPDLETGAWPNNNIIIQDKLEAGDMFWSYQVSSSDSSSETASE